MATICYPYGSGITCVCDGPNIYKCFPDLKVGEGQVGGQGDHQGAMVLGTNHLMDTDQGAGDTLGMDRR